MGVDLLDAHRELLALLEQVVGAPGAVAGAELGDVQEALQPGLELHEGPEGHQAHHLGRDHLVGAVAVAHGLPGVGLELLHAQADALAALLDVQHLDLDVLAHLDLVVGVLDAPARHVGHVDQSLDPAAQVDEGPEGLDAGDLSGDDQTRLQGSDGVLERLLALGGQHPAAREQDALAAAIDLQHLAHEALVDAGGEVLDSAQVDVGGRHEGRQGADLELQAAGVVAGDPGLDPRAGVDLVPGGQDLGLPTGEVPQPVLGLAVEAEVEHLADLGGVFELLGRDHPLDAGAQLHDHVVAVDPHDGAAVQAGVVGAAGAPLEAAGLQALQVDALQGGVDLGQHGIGLFGLLGAHGSREGREGDRRRARPSPTGEGGPSCYRRAAVRVSSPPPRVDKSGAGVGALSRGGSAPRRWPGRWARGRSRRRSRAGAGRRPTGPRRPRPRG